RLLAKSLNCLNLKLSEPCGSCENCCEIQENRSVDLVEIDAASNRGIDDIRALKEDIKFAPFKSNYKIFVIDEVHQLTKDAFNALLKTLEEPPSHTIFILATTDIEKVPVTILSRVQRFDFKKITLDEIKFSLKEIIKKEKIEASEESLKNIALNASGSLRDAQSMLNQVISFSGPVIKENDVESVLGLVSSVLVSRFTELLIKKDLKNSLIFLTDLENDGHDVENLLKSTIEYLRKILIIKVDLDLISLFKEEFSDEEKKIILGQVNLTDHLFLKKLMDNFLTAQNQMKYSDFPKIPLELAVIESLM
ncbi:MAG: DNA polymerase III subunit gamma/tau, partial [Candidatus Staskawiczbacteria bacterium]|nr:DNA polymerase III subunit gamma/tau [Candidatus Staskawiczbacteria bacterium]